MPDRINPQTLSLPPELARIVDTLLAEWTAGHKVERLWARDATLWTGADESQWLGWLDLLGDQGPDLDPILALATQVRAEGFTHALLLGMGGSSLCPEVMAMTFGHAPGYPELRVLDSTDPAQVASVERSVDLKRTLCIVSSKSGSTLEPNIFKQYFFERVRGAVGPQEVNRRFIAITDPGSRMERAAQADHFRAIFFGSPSVGGRYSALSSFGIVPAAILGVDVARFLSRTREMANACGSSVPASENPGVKLGLVLGAAARDLHRDKVTIVASPGIHDVGAWLEQLLAESTGKEGKGLIPVDSERPASPPVYGADRIFAYLRLETGADPAQDAAVAELERSGHPVVRIAIDDVYGLGQEYFRWEFATAVAGAVIGIHPFDQPDVEASKVATRRLTEAYERTGALPPEAPFWSGDALALFADEANANVLRRGASRGTSLAGYIGALLGLLSAGDYFALLAYVEMSAAHERLLQDIRHAVRDRKRVATCLGFGPRFLHSTGQAYKGGPNSGVFLQITCDDQVDLPVPGQRYMFGTVKAAQARGDFQVLAERNRRALRVHLGPQVAAGLETLARAIREALG